jgi:hypothetical protein
MKLIPAVTCLATSLVFAGCASVTKQDDTHHPASASASAAAKSAAAMPGKPAMKDAIGKMDMQMGMMRDMHEKMMAAKTPEQRNAMMAEHMKMMQDGMAMMGNMKMMGGAGMGMKSGMPADNDRAQMMEKRVEMMETMMQMMLDRLPAANPVPASK